MTNLRIVESSSPNSHEDERYVEMQYRLEPTREFRIKFVPPCDDDRLSGIEEEFNPKKVIHRNEDGCEYIAWEVASETDSLDSFQDRSKQIANLLGYAVLDGVWDYDSSKLGYL